MTEVSEDLLRGVLKIKQPGEKEGPRVNLDTILLAHYARPKKREKILEIGCAHGAVSLILAKRGHSIEGVDIQPHLVEMAAENAAANGLGQACVPAMLAEADIAAGRVRQVGEAMDTKRGYWLVAPTPQWRQAKVKALVAALTA